MALDQQRPIIRLRLCEVLVDVEKCAVLFDVSGEVRRQVNEGDIFTSRWPRLFTCHVTVNLVHVEDAELRCRSLIEPDQANRLFQLAEICSDVSAG